MDCEEQEGRRKKRQRLTPISYNFQGQNFSCFGRDLEQCFFVRVDDNNVTCKINDCKHPNYKQALKNGYSNVKSHLTHYHTDSWVQELHEFLTGEEVVVQPKITSMITVGGVPQKAKELHSWISIIVEKSLPFNIVEDSGFRIFKEGKYTFSRRVVRSVMDEIGLRIQRKICSLLPEKFGIILDGWAASKGTHLMALFATFPHAESPGGKGRRLIAVTTMVDETNFSAESHADTIKQRLWDSFAINHELTKNIVFITADNAPVNYKLASLLEVPMIGCFSHRLNLCCRDVFARYEEILNKYSCIMDSIANSNVIMGKLRDHPDKLKYPVQRNKTRWTSTFQFIKRTIDLFDYLVELFDEAPETCQSITILDKNTLKKLDELMKPFYKLTLKLQYDGEKSPTLSFARKCFQKLFHNPNYAELLGSRPNDAYFPGKYLLPSYDNGKASASSVNVKFQDALEKIQDKREGELTLPETNCVSVFTKNEVVVVDKNLNPEIDEFDEIRMNMNRNDDESAYIPLNWIDCTSNVCERLFSQARLLLHYLRKKMTPASIEILLYLRANRDLWDAKMVQDILSKKTNLEDSEDPIVANDSEEESDTDL